MFKPLQLQLHLQQQHHQQQQQQQPKPQQKQMEDMKAKKDLSHYVNHQQPKPSVDSSPKVVRAAFESPPKVVRAAFESPPARQTTRIANNYLPNVVGSAVTKPSTTKDSMQSKFIDEALRKHNELRARHGVPDLVHNSELSKIALDYAKKLAKLKTLVHSGAKYREASMGENLAYAFDSSRDYYGGDEATLSWYSEIKKHNFQDDHQAGTGHFTQVHNNSSEVLF